MFVEDQSNIQKGHIHVYIDNLRAQEIVLFTSFVHKGESFIEKYLFFGRTFPSLVVCCSSLSDTMVIMHARLRFALRQ